MNNEHTDIRRLTLLAATGCNLQCKYCAIAKTTNEHSKTLFSETIKALDDGTYLENTLKCLERLGESPYKIEGFDIWGQEPTMIISHVSKNWGDWYAAYPNIKSTFFSTNGIDMVDQIYDFVVAVNEVATKEIQMDFQVSYDGAYGTENVRGGEGSSILNNCIELNKKFNQTHLPNVNVSFNFHGVVSNDLIEYLDNFEKIDAYLKEIESFLKQVRDTNISKHIRWNGITLQYENGTDVHAEQGIRLADFVRKIEHLRHENTYTFFNDGESFIMELLGGSIYMLEEKMKEYNSPTLDAYVNDVLNRSDVDLNRKYKQAPYCGPARSELKVIYDGTLVTCQNSIYDIQIDKSTLENTVRDEARWGQMTHGHRINFINDSDEDIEKYLSFIDNTFNGSVQYFMIGNIANLMYCLAKIGQISPSYLTDMEKLKRHAFILSNVNCCYYNLVVNSGSNVIRNASEIRLLCNGVLDLYEEAVNLRLFRNKE
ncbi:hypothetical protein M2140_000128 [Clostridiales Family XIII bacterium PM5-7]